MRNINYRGSRSPTYWLFYVVVLADDRQAMYKTYNARAICLLIKSSV